MDFLAFIWMVLPLIRVISLLLFFGGIFLVVLRWGRPTLKSEECNVIEKTYRISWRRKISVVSKVIVSYWVLGILVYKRSRVRGLAHTCILASSIGLLIFHIVPRVILGTKEAYLFPSILMLTWNTVHSVFCLMLIFGVTTLLAYKLVQKGIRWATKVYYLIPLFLLLVIGLTGFILENIKLLGWVEFYNYFYLIHYIIVYTTIMFIPYGLIHVLATSITTMAYAFREMHTKNGE